MDPIEARIRAIAETARRWSDPEHPPRVEAVERTLAGPGRFTEEAVAFAVNQQMHELTAPALGAWIRGRRSRRPLRVGVLGAGNVPLADLQDFLAVVLTGHEFVGSVSSRSPALLPAFVDELETLQADLGARFVPAAELVASVDALIASGSDETIERVREACERRGIGEGRRLLRGHRFGVAVIDGKETEPEREGLAEDVLLHEGYGCRNVALVWAPRNLEPDPYLHALAAFRAVFPVHPEMPGALAMQRAYLRAIDQPHAFGEGNEFLLSRGEPEVQRPGHVRWTEYDELSDAVTWIQSHADRIQVVAARSELQPALPQSLPLTEPGTAQRPPLDWRPDGIDTVDFLTTI
jgi:hypothetical protein